MATRCGTRGTSWSRSATRQQEYFVSGTAPRARRHHRAVHHAHHRVPAARGGALQRRRDARLGQRHRAVRERRRHPRGPELLLREGWAFVHVSAQKAGVCCIPLTPKAGTRCGTPRSTTPATPMPPTCSARSPRRCGRTQGLDPMSGPEGEAGDRRRAVAVGRQALQLRQRLAGPGRGHRRVPDPRQRHGEEDLPGAADRAGAEPAVRPRGRARGADGRTALPALGGRGAPRTPTTSSASSPCRATARGLPTSRRRPGGYRAIIDEAGNYGQLLDPARTPARSPARRCRCTTDLAALHQLEPLGPHRQAPARGRRATSSPASALAKDEHGNTLGGIRLPPVEVPVARYESTACNLGGITVPLATPADPVAVPDVRRLPAADGEATDRAVRRGWLLPPDAKDQMRRVCTVPARYPDAERGTCRAAVYDPPRFASVR